MDLYDISETDGGNRRVVSIGYLDPVIEPQVPLHYFGASQFACFSHRRILRERGRREVSALSIEHDRIII